ncbi:MAG TPA: tetratricopeptide repeat protein [Gemmatimonadales bacterium]|jgi:tetratricopeptide (TPR) repeat protein|nr:tetratricopeptide repeat protein [Gemmatimonadales bacterium]
MATHTHTAAPATGASRAQVEPLPERLLDWTSRHRQAVSWIVVALIVALGLFVWTMSSNRRSEVIAGRQLQGARYAFDQQNLPLAASELSRIIENYSGTHAAAEARLLLAQLRLVQGQPQQAVELLRDFAPGASAAYQAQAYGLLGAAYENMGRPREAADAYQAGAERARMDFLKAQMLSDAGRAWTVAGDTAKAVATYRRIVDEFPKQVAVTEAKVRLGELTKGAGSP